MEKRQMILRNWSIVFPVPQAFMMRFRDFRTIGEALQWFWNDPSAKTLKVGGQWMFWGEIYGHESKPDGTPHVTSTPINVYKDTRKKCLVVKVADIRKVQKTGRKKIVESESWSYICYMDDYNKDFKAFMTDYPNFNLDQGHYLSTYPHRDKKNML